MSTPLGVSSGLAPVQVGVDTTSATIVSENYSRVGLLLTNLSTGTVYLGFGLNAAVIGSGAVLGPSGGSFSMDEFSYTKEAVNAIAHADNSLLAIQEFVVRS